jgi:glucose-6-phosphate 1-dehydrogenase
MNKDIDLFLFGAAGDLAARKLLPALYHLEYSGLLPAGVRIHTLARRDWSNTEFLDNLREKLRARINAQHWSEEVWQSLAGRSRFLRLDFGNPDDFDLLAKCTDPQRTSIFYLATPPSSFAPICESLGASNALQADSRIVLEKPIGHDLASCRLVNDTVARFFPEENIYRIDHYLGKETVQNLLVLRFANRFINQQWDQSCIDHVQISVAETIGIEGRWSYYDRVGQVRDMLQNHLMQLLCLVAMEPPHALSARAIREEKVKVLRSLRVMDPESAAEHLVRGQYEAGWIGGKPVGGYLDDAGGAASASDTETFVALKLYIDNWRWAGVPFYLRTGKRMTQKLTEIVITYKALPHTIFAGGLEMPNRLVIRLQPNEGIQMQMVSKLHSLKQRMALLRQDLNLDFLGSADMQRIPDAYERLLIDLFNADQSLYVGREEVEESWRWCDALSKAWESRELPVRGYPAGSWGPPRAELLMEKDGRQWHD